MTQQINLYDPALLRKRELLSAVNLAAAAAVLLVFIGAWAVLARAQLATLEAEQQTLAPQLKTMQDQMTALAKQVGAMKPDPRIEAELASARALLSVRGEVLGVLEKSIGGGATSFAEYLRALARQSVAGLWLTGFTVGEGGGMEIRGRMTDPERLPEYIRRLNSEKAFQGRSFAALQVSPGQAAAPAGTVSAPAAAAAPATAPFHEFVLAPEHVAPSATPGRMESRR